MLRFSAMVFATGFLTSPLSVAEPAARPNILFIVTDQQFAEAMSNRMGREHKDPLVATLLADGVKPIPFPTTAE